MRIGARGVTNKPHMPALGEFRVPGCRTVAAESRGSQSRGSSSRPSRSPWGWSHGTTRGGYVQVWPSPWSLCSPARVTETHRACSLAVEGGDGRGGGT